jgi:hypothetical protein
MFDPAEDESVDLVANPQDMTVNDGPSIVGRDKRARQLMGRVEGGGHLLSLDALGLGAGLFRPLDVLGCRLVVLTHGG